MAAVFLVIALVGMLLLGNELWWRRQAPSSEWSRKFIHITVGSFVAFWPFFLSWETIRWLSLSFVVVVAVSKYLKIFQAIHSVQRPTLGELYFAIAVGLTTLVTQNKWIYMVSLLQMSLADGLAAVIGVRYGKQSYLMFGHRKSWLGSLTFFVISLTILIVYGQIGNQALEPVHIVGLAGLATIIENLGVQGIDNLLVPLLVAWLLAMR